MATMQSILDLARFDLSDAKDPVTGDENARNKDVDMLAFANDGLAKAYALRSDLRWGNYATAFTDLAVTDAFPLSLEYRPGIVNYVVARCESSDDAFVIQQRANQSLALYFKDIGVA